MTGTSPATAIMAGMAGMFLWHEVCRPNSGPLPNILGRPRRPRRPRAQLLLAILDRAASRTLNDGYSYVAPWTLENIPERTRWERLKAALAPGHVPQDVQSESSAEPLPGLK
jgi:hypothetical protein